MIRPRAGLAAALLAAAATAAFAASPSPMAPSRAAPAPAARSDAPDTSLGGYLNTLADSTDQYFGRSAVPADTAGLDTLVGRPMQNLVERRLSFGGYPTYAFNRVDGSTLGGVLDVHGPNRTGTLTLRGAWAMGPDLWQGGGRYENRFRIGGQRGFRVEAWAGRATAGMSREDGLSLLSRLAGLVSGGDYTQYLQRDGVSFEAGRDTRAWNALIGYRDQLETPRVTTATWNFSHQTPVVVGNLAAARGRARELLLAGGVALPLVPVRVEVEHATSGDALRSDFTYRRTRVTAGGDWSLGRAASLVPQFTYGRLTGDALPQASFYLGGDPTLRSVHRQTVGGTGLAFARLELVSASDVLAALHLPHPAALPVQASAFGASGATWGVDPLGGPEVAGVDWPRRQSWLSEVGVALHVPLGFSTSRLTACYAWPLGPTAGRSPGLTVEISRPIDLLRPPFEEDEP